ncbi:MAG: hypothetical protein LBI10_01240 [Deltaproteobacteria bacterium]|jgi:hypothetical protein|nr:hypothetical protein [Deltaproteobacteria bacterium]
MFKRLALVNAGSILALFLAYCFQSLVRIFTSNDTILSLIVYLLFTIIVVFYLVFSYIILFKNQKTNIITFDGKKIESISVYIQLLNDYIKQHGYTFKKDLLSTIKYCESFIKKRELVFSTLLSHFTKTEISFIKFSSIINGVENTFAVTVNNILIRLNAFDEKEYEDFFRQKKSTSANQAKRQQIFDDYQEFLKSSLNFLDQILIKMDQLQLEISKLSALDYQDIENNELIKEIDALTKTMKLYK